MKNYGNAALYGSRLVRLLSGFHPTVSEAPAGNFADKLGQLMGLQGSIILALAHDELGAMVFNPAGLAPQAAAKSVKDEFLQARTALVRSIAMGFVPGGGGIKDKLPTAEGLHAHFKLTGVYEPALMGRTKIHRTAFEPFGKFYTARQRELENRIRQLRLNIGRAIEGISPELAKLSRLDATFGRVLAEHTRELFTVVPKLLEKRFGSLLDEHRQELPSVPTAPDLEQWLQPGGWLFRFCGEMRELLLAELEVRLQPLLGMIDSLPAEAGADCTHDEGKK